MRRREPEPVWEIVQDEHGRILGKMRSRSAVLERDMEYVRKFLTAIQKEVREMAVNRVNEDAGKDRCNMVWLAGLIKSLRVGDDGSAFCLLDPEGETKFIPCTVYQDDKLAARLGRFQEGDPIKLRGYVRAWSQKKNGGWENKVEVRITEIKSEPPERSRKAVAVDDDIPF